MATMEQLQNFAMMVVGVKTRAEILELRSSLELLTIVYDEVMGDIRELQQLDRDKEIGQAVEETR